MHALLVVLLVAPAAGPGAAEEDEEFLKLWQEVRAEVEQMIYEFPELPPTFDLTLGFRTFDVEGAARAMQYGDPTTFGTASAHFTSYSELQRFNMSGHLESPSDYGLDLAYWLGDVLFTRALVTGVRHNAVERQLLDLGPAERYGVSVLEEVDDPHTDVSRVNLDVRLRAPGYPAHAFFHGRLVSRRERLSDELLGGSGFWDDLTRTTVASTNETLATDLRAGINAHLGPVEVQAMHSEYWLDRRSPPLEFDYANIEGASGPTYIHNQIPRVRGRTEELRLHTTHTGRIAASATAARQVRRNVSFDIGETALFADANLRWLPIAGLVLAASYRYRDVENDTPDTIALRDLATGTITAFDIKPPVDATTHTITARVRYRPVRAMAMRASWRRVVRERHNGDLWKLPERSLRDTIAGVIEYRLSRDADLRLTYERVENQAPAYNTDPDSRDRVRTRVHWTPIDVLTLHLEHEWMRDVIAESRFDLLDTQVIAAGGERQTHNVFVQADLIPDPSMTLVATYGFLQLAHDPTLSLQTFSQAAPGFEVDHGASYAEQTHIVALSFVHIPVEQLELRASGSYSIGTAMLSPTVLDAVEPVSIGRIARSTVHQSHAQLTVVWRLPRDWRVELDGVWDQIRFGNQQYNPRRNGRVLGGGVTVGKHW